MSGVQDPLVHCQGAEGVLDGGPDVVSGGTGHGGGRRGQLTGADETESACSCSGSCSGSCADSGRAPSEDDDQKHHPTTPLSPAAAAAASRSSCIHRPLLAKAGDAYGKIQFSKF